MTGPDHDAGETDRVLAAAEVAFARVMAGVPSPVESMPPDLEPADVLRWAGDRVTELLAGFAELPLDRLLGLAQPARDAAPAEPGPRGAPLTVRVGPGSVAQARIWVHLVGTVAPATMRFTLTDLTASTGDALGGIGPVFEPAALRLPVAAGASTVLRLRIPDEAAPGTYHGLVVGLGVPDAVVPLTLVITGTG